MHSTGSNLHQRDEPKAARAGTNPLWPHRAECEPVIDSCLIIVCCFLLRGGTGRPPQQPLVNAVFNYDIKLSIYLCLYMCLMVEEELSHASFLISESAAENNPMLGHVMTFSS